MDSAASWETTASLTSLLIFSLIFLSVPPHLPLIFFLSSSPDGEMRSDTVTTGSPFLQCLFFFFFWQLKSLWDFSHRNIKAFISTGVIP